MSLEFYKTQAGRRFYDGVMPRIADALERIADHLETEKKVERDDVTRPPFSTKAMVDSALTDITSMAKQAAEDACKYDK